MTTWWTALGTPSAKPSPGDGMRPSRRDLLCAVAAGVASPAWPRLSAPDTVRPPALRPGDKVALVAPGGFIDKPQDVQAAIEGVRSLGLEPFLAPHANDRFGYLAGTDEDRASDINQMVNDRSVKALIALRGGYGCSRLLPLLDYRAFRANPKVLLGYSDVTALLVAVQKKSHVVTFHGPVGESTFNEFTVSWLKRAVCRAEPLGALPAGKGETLVPGSGEGRLVGGNLTLIASVLGSPFEADLDGAIMFLEDVNEDPYRVDRLLTSLVLRGFTKRLKGIVFGSLRPPKPDPEVPPGSGFTMDEVVRERCQAIGVPAFSGLSFGHTLDKLTLPLGVKARLDADTKTLTVLEPAVA